MKSTPTRKDHTSDPTKILPCTCHHPYQDGKYGQNNRVHNPRKEGPNKKPVYACTVCGREKE
jgi:hypothetical protein